MLDFFKSDVSIIIILGINFILFISIIISNARINRINKNNKEFMKKLGKVAYEKGLGVSGLVGEVEEITWQPFVDVISNQGEYEEIIISDKTIDDNTNYQFVKRKK